MPTMTGQSIPFKQHIAATKPYKGGSTRSAASAVRYKLSSNENLLGPSPLALAAIGDHLSGLNEYDYENDIPLRSALEQHIGLTADQYLTANSGMELLDLICRAFLEPHDEVILCSPCFMAYASFAQLAGARVIDIPLDPEDFSLNITGVLNAITKHTRLLFLSNPNNPTGSLITTQELETLLAKLPERVVVVYDEVYHHYVSSPAYPRASTYIARGVPMIGIHSFSKAFGLAGIRLGYAFSTPLISDYLSHLRRPFMINTLSTVAGIAALGDTEHLFATRLLVQGEREWLYTQFAAAGLPYWRSEGNFILVRPPSYASTFVDSLLADGIMVRPTEVMRAPGCIRITVGTREANEALVRSIGRHLNKQ